MQYYFTNRKRTIKAKTTCELISWMRDCDLEHSDSNEHFMKLYAHRKWMFEQISIRYKNEEQFVEDLIIANIVQPVKRSILGIAI